MAAIAQRRIDFTNDPAATKPISKPANLANSAVLRMLEEQEEQRRQGQDPGFRTVAWPPPNETHFVPKASTPAPTSSNGPQQYSSQGPATPQYQRAPSQPPAYTPQAVAPQQYQAQQPQQQQQYHPQPAGYGQPTMASVAAPQQQQQYQPITQRQPSPSSGMVTLRQSTPVSQKPAPVYQSQPPVSSFNGKKWGKGGGAHMRGDMKWPPEECKQQAAKENEERLRLAAGPACRPRRVNKDYGSFFARHALNNTYPGYRVPPGTQHYPNEM